MSRTLLAVHRNSSSGFLVRICTMMNIRTFLASVKLTSENDLQRVQIVMEFSSLNSHHVDSDRPPLPALSQYR